MTDMIYTHTQQATVDPSAAGRQAGALCRDDDGTRLDSHTYCYNSFSFYEIAQRIPGNMPDFITIFQRVWYKFVYLLTHKCCVYHIITLAIIMYDSNK